jgi:CheY-like chemotaxis protein
MPTLDDVVPVPTTLEALPRPPRRRGVRAASGEAPEGEDLLTGLWRGPARRAHLPRVLAGVRVLVVDDDEDAADLFATALTACGADVVTAATALGGLHAVAAQTPDVVVTDIAMPGADGYWLLREIRQLADERVRAVPVVAVTAFGREHVRARALAAGFVDHLEKPVDPAALCLAVARARAR